MKCQYIHDCPSVSGWCLNRKPTERCVYHVEIAIYTMKDKLRDAERVYEGIKHLKDCANLPVGEVD